MRDIGSGADPVHECRRLSHRERCGVGIALPQRVSVGLRGIIEMGAEFVLTLMPLLRELVEMDSRCDSLRPFHSEDLLFNDVEDFGVDGVLLSVSY
jgi:hypothetical protein